MDQHGDIALSYERFADLEARGVSPLYEELARGVAADPTMLGFLAELPRIKQQPNLLFAAVRFVAGTSGGYADFRERALANRDAVSKTMRTRLTQTNEAARCATLLPILAGLPQPLALLEVGASAGLCLQPDRYRYEYSRGGVTTTVEGASELTIRCEVEGEQLPSMKLPTVAWRAGLDLNPLDVNDRNDVTWLETLIWPEHVERLDRLRTAVRIARATPPRIVRGDAVEGLRGVVKQAPRDATLVVFHSSTMNYVPADHREQFVDQLATIDAHWISLEGPGVFPQIAARVGDQPRRDTATTLVALDGAPVAYAAPHGGWLRWF